ncbi:MAG: hypothetical protein LBC51_07990 [Treponema sp.]|nr:hypothetical protein [Treponema sp.]
MNPVQPLNPLPAVPRLLAPYTRNTTQTRTPAAAAYGLLGLWPGKGDSGSKLTLKGDATAVIRSGTHSLTLGYAVKGDERYLLQETTRRLILSITLSQDCALVVSDPGLAGIWKLTRDGQDYYYDLKADGTGTFHTLGASVAAKLAVTQGEIDGTLEMEQDGSPGLGIWKADGSTLYLYSPSMSAPSPQIIPYGISGSILGFAGIVYTRQEQPGKHRHLGILKPRRMVCRPPVFLKAGPRAAIPKTTSPGTPGTIPRALGAIPRAPGTIPRTLGAIPRALGTIPRTLGVIPRALGAIPRALGVIPGASEYLPKLPTPSRGPEWRMMVLLPVPAGIPARPHLIADTHPLRPLPGCLPCLGSAEWLCPCRSDPLRRHRPPARRVPPASGYTPPGKPQSGPGYY